MLLMLKISMLTKIRFKKIRVNAEPRLSRFPLEEAP